MCDCADCEQLLQPYLDRELNDAERVEAEQHLEACSYCARRYRFEAELRRFVRTAATEPMPADLRARLASIRIAL
jgi:anti-sigma factor (TIGR02949 family)